jgi:uncharacterized membrane protein
MTVVRHWPAWVVLALLASIPGMTLPAAAAVSAREVTKDGGTQIVLSNDRVQLTFAPAHGGRCTSFRLLPSGEEFVGKDQLGFFLDHWAKYVWPSGLYHLPYQHAIVGDGKTRAGVHLWIVVPAKGGGAGASGASASKAIDTSPELIGLEVHKTIWLTAGSDLVEVEHRIVNPTEGSRSVAPYMQHHFNINGSRFFDTWYMPSNQGVMWRIQPEDEYGKAYGPEWIMEPTAGWMAVRDRQTNAGLLFTFDYNYLRKMYTCGETAEWFMEAVPVSAGKQFTTRYCVKPVTGFDGFVYGSERLVANIAAREKGKDVHITHDVMAVGQPLPNAETTIMVMDWKSKQVIVKRSWTDKAIGGKQMRHALTCTPRKTADGLLIRVSVQSKGTTEQYELFYAGDIYEHERRYSHFATGGGALPEAKGDAYFVQAPRKVKTIDKPDFADIPRPTPDTFRVFAAFGLYTDFFAFDDAVEGWKSRGGAAPQFTWVNCPPNGIESFPGSYEELFGYNLIILGDVNYRALGDIPMEMLCDYVEQGGSLLVTGGPYALGNGEFEGSRFLEVLPATLSGPFDMQWAGKGKSWALQAAPDGKALMQGVAFAQTPRVYWQHAVTPKPGATVALTAGGKPSLVLGRYGKGRVALLTLSPNGDPAAGETAWWDWDGWYTLMKNLFTWLNV